MNFSDPPPAHPRCRRSCIPAVPIAPATVLMFAAAMGFLWLGVIPLVTGLIGRVFGLSHFNTLYGLSYNFAWAAPIVIGLTAFTLQWMMDERPPEEKGSSGRAVPVPA